jgi:hypothetical protein
MITNLITYKRGDIAITGVCVAIDENTITLRFPVKDSDKVVDEKVSLLGCTLIMHTNRNILQTTQRDCVCQMIPKEGEDKDVITYSFFNPFHRVEVIKDF